jgi:hypothetical protein
MMRKVLFTGLTLAAAVLVVRAVPDFARYVKIVMM